MNDTANTKTVATVPLPSADLINYRFDQADRQFDKLNKKLDDMTTNFVTSAYVAQLVSDGDKKHTALQQQIDDIKRNAKWWVGVILTICTIAVAAVAIFK